VKSHNSPYVVPYASDWWWSIFQNRKIMSISLTDEITIPLERSSLEGIVQPLGLERLDSFDIRLPIKDTHTTIVKLTRFLDEKKVTGLLLNHVPASSPLLYLAIMESPRWEARIWPQSVMVCSHVPRQSIRDKNKLYRLAKVEQLHNQSKLETLDITDLSLDTKLDLFAKVVKNSPHPEWHSPWVGETSDQLACLLSNKDDVRVRMLATLNSNGECLSLLVAFQIRNRIYVYKSITTIDGRKCFAGLASWSYLESKAREWDVTTLFLGIGLHHYKKYWYEWSEVQFGVLLRSWTGDKNDLFDNGFALREVGYKLENWILPKDS
jgi:hypothetical protein